MSDINKEVAEKVMKCVMETDWMPSIRIDHAWMVVDHMKAEGWKFHLADGMFGMNYLCAFYRGTHSDSLQADTAQEAICLAALKAKEVEMIKRPDYYDEICANCGCTYGSHHAGSSSWPKDYCPGHEGKMDWIFQE